EGAYPGGTRSDAYDLLEKLLNTKLISACVFNILGKNPLHYAIDKNNKDMETLLMKSLDNEMENRIKIMPPIFTDSTKKLYSDYIKKPKPTLNALFEATYEGDITQVKSSIESGTNPNITFINNDKDEITSLHIAVDNNDIQTAALLLAHGANVDGLDVDQPEENEHPAKTPLMNAVINKNITMAEMLLDAQAQVNLEDQLGTTALHMAVRDNHIEMVNLLIKYNADMNLRDQYDYTPLDVAIQKDNVHMVRHLLCVDGLNAESYAPLVSIVDQGLSETMKCLLCVDKLRVEWDDLGGASNSALHHALDRDEAFYESIANLTNDEKNKKIIELVNALLNAGAQVKENIFSDSPLHIAVHNDHCTEVIQLILDKGANINLQDDHDYTPLHLAIEENNSENVKLLLGYGADPKIPNEDDDTALMFAQNKGYSEIASLIEAHIARDTDEWVDNCFDF
ncbi:MAG TPA: ankyrin repeat domain-containing protein, partial [Candidatus Babeliales bacterium]|nr:ankyrin repeat domain-containing protein [Candidatus Babeliales bacterium]